MPDGNCSVTNAGMRSLGPGGGLVWLIGLSGVRPFIPPCPMPRIDAYCFTGVNDYPMDFPTQAGEENV